MSNNIKPLIKVVEGKITKKMWLANGRGKRLSSKFELYGISEDGDFVTLRTSEGRYVYHKGLSNILHKDNDAYVIKITDDLYGVTISTKMKSGFEAYIYDAKGKLLLRGLDYVCHMSNELFAVKKEDKWGFMDSSLKFVISPQWEYVTSFNEKGYAIVCFKGGKRIGVIDKRGTYILPYAEYKDASFETPELLRVKSSEGKDGIITVKGDIIVPAIYYSIHHIGDFFIVSAKGKYGLIDINGNEIFECIYPEIIETDKKFVVQDFARLEVSKVKEVTK